MNKYVIISTASIVILACKTVSILLPSGSTPPDSSAPSSTETSVQVEVNENSLVGRNPSEWFPDPEVFSALNDIPFQGAEGYVNEDYAAFTFDPVTQKDKWQEKLDFYNQTGRIVNYDYQWYIYDCNTNSDSPAAQILATIYKDAKGAQAGLEAYSKFYNTPTNPKKEVDVGDIGYTAFFSTPSCGFGGWTAFVYFRRNNIFGIVGVTTYKLSANFEKLDLALALAKQLDQIILNEMAYHPGKQSDLVALQKSAKTIELSLSEAQNPPSGSGNPYDFISTSLYCTGNYYSGNLGTYDVQGTVENTSESPIMLTIEWGADDTGNVYFSDAQSTTFTKTVRLAQNYTSTIDLEGAEFISDTSGFPYTACKIYSITASWVQ